MDSTLVAKETIQIVFGDNGVLGVLGIVASILISLAGFVLALLSYLNSQKQTKISEDAKDAALLSANTAVESAKTAEKAVGEGFRPYVKINSQIHWERIDENGDKYYSFKLLIKNIGNRLCFIAELNISPPIKLKVPILESGVILIKDIEITNSLFPILNVNDTLFVFVNNYPVCIINDIDTKYTITIHYQDASKNEYEEILYECKLSNIEEPYT